MPVVPSHHHRYRSFSRTAHIQTAALIPLFSFIFDEKEQMRDPFNITT